MNIQLIFLIHNVFAIRFRTCPSICKLTFENPYNCKIAIHLVLGTFITYVIDFIYINLIYTIPLSFIKQLNTETLSFGGNHAA